MIIKNKRFSEKNNTTIGLLSIDGVHEGFILEDKYREIKIPKQTRIPSGEYTVVLRTHGSFHERYSQKYKDIHKGMLEISGVKGFSDILFHIGNTIRDTAGCQLVGMAPSMDMDMIIHSEIAYLNFYKKVLRAIEAKQKVIYKVEDEDFRLKGSK